MVLFSIQIEYIINSGLLAVVGRRTSALMLWAALLPLFLLPRFSEKSGNLFSEKGMGRREKIKNNIFIEQNEIWF